MVEGNGRKVPTRRRVAVCATCVTLTLAACVGYTAADVADVAPGLLTLKSVATRTYPDPVSTIAAGDVAGDVDAGKTIDKTQAEALIRALGEAEGVGDNYSVVHDEDAHRVRRREHARNGGDARHRHLPHP